MNKFHVLFFAFLQPITAYHGGFQYSSFNENRQSARNDHANFENFHVNRRQSTGFDWDSDTIFNRRPSTQFNRNNDAQDSFIFEDDFDNRDYVSRTTHRTPVPRRRPSTQRIPTSTVAIPGMGTPRTPCEDRCLTTPEYNPVCGDDDMTYFSRHRLNCAQRCGKRVKLKHLGACTLIPPRG